MSSESTSQTGRRRRGGNPRNRSNRSNQGGRPGRGKSTPPPKPQSFWDKIVAFFTGNKPATKSVSKPTLDKLRNAKAPAQRSAPIQTSRKPEMVEVTTERLYVGNLSYDATESDLFDLFNGVGLVQNAEVVSHKHTQRSKGFAFVQMQSVDEAKRAVELLHDKDYMGRKLVVSGAKKPNEDRSDSRDDYDDLEARD